ncbi:DUF4157 domain-containing protein [Streptomyces sp. NPDC021562]|uniref:eCIS core domain-containing protein n=1 Tax=Streptomyces sp. NPDC021562 TaxID=3155121 RepID=UPI001052617F
MGLARDENTTTGQRRAPQRPRAIPTTAGTTVQRMLAEQSRAGNQAVVEMLRRSGHPGAQDRHQHGPACGHRSSQPPVQRSAPGSTVARTEDEHGHSEVHDTSPEGQSALLAAAMSSSSESLPSSVVAKAGAFYQNDRLSSTRVHRDAVAQRATAAMGAQAMTVGNHIFLSAGTAGDDKLIGHELSHVDKNLKGLPETGNSNGAGVTITDPRQDSEQAAERDGSAYAAGQATAPSLAAPRAAANDSHGPVQRMPEEGESSEAPQGGRRLALESKAADASIEDHIAQLPEDSEEEVILKRGVTPTQRMHLQKEIIRGSFVSFPAILRQPDENATRPDPTHVYEYTSQHRNDNTAQLIEFSTNPTTALQFATEARFGYLLTIRIKRKYLMKGSQSEFGWISRQGAPYDIVAVERRDSTAEGIVALTEAEFREVVRNEEMAEFLLSVQDPIAMAAHLSRFQGAEKLAEARRITSLRNQMYS